jgi:predicted amidophosphoribosyltransferase
MAAIPNGRACRQCGKKWAQVRGLCRTCASGLDANARLRAFLASKPPAYLAGYRDGYEAALAWQREQDMRRTA